MKLFNTLLEIKTSKKDLPMKAVFIENSLYPTEWAYFIYYYDLVNHTFYINDLYYLWTKYRTSAINIIENIITKAYKQEINSLAPHLAKSLIIKKPKVYNFYKTKDWLIIIDKINLQAIRWKEGDIFWFKNPVWNVNDSNEIKADKLKNNILDFYENQPMN